MLEMLDFVFGEVEPDAKRDPNRKAYYFWAARDRTQLVRVYVSRAALRAKLGLAPGERFGRALMRSRQSIEAAANSKWLPGDCNVFLEESDF
ncbi:MAG: hypothetical protein AB7F41_13940 [Methylocystis sp.]|uniref:hypothetical protein n=1 Tax=Methylocystis sp. TaxID=1911079 RepID=UPI003D0A6752